MEEIAGLPGSGEILWLDLDEPTPEEAEILSRLFGFHPLAIEDCWHEPQAPKADDYDDYVFMVVHGVRYDAATEDFITHELNVFLGTNYLVTFHLFHSRSIESTQDLIRRSPAVMAKGSDFVLHCILDRLVDNYLPKLEIIEDKIEELENAVFEKPEPELLNRIFTLRHSVIHLKRVAGHEREVLVRLSRGELPHVGERMQFYFRDIYDHMLRIVETADNHRETLNIILELYLSQVSNQLNDTMRVLTVLTAVILPLTVITGVYGMNFANMPELQWRYGYFTVIAMMVLVTGSMLFYFRRKKWL